MNLAWSLAREWERSVHCTGEARVLADPLRLRQIMRNLLTNAFRYGGEVVWVEVAARDGRVVIDVCDSGDPIPEERVVTMFDPFDHEEGDGRRPHSVGLGLAVAKSLAGLTNGDLCYRHDAMASVFELTLPAATEPSRLELPADTGPVAIGTVAQ